MANGIEWFRWHHGSVTDPKFQLVARKAGASLPDVLAVWAYLLEKASAADFRGCFGDIDAEAVDCMFGFDDGLSDAILAAMVDRKLIADEYVVAWEKRQPKRERADDSSTERVRAFRQKQRNETQGNATERQETPREEESREEKKEIREEEKREEKTRVTALVILGVDERVLSDFKALRKAKRSPLTQTAINGIQREANKAGISLQDALEMACQRGWTGFKADWVTAAPPAFQKPALSDTVPSRAVDETARLLAEDAAHRAEVARQRMARLAGRVAA